MHIAAVYGAHLLYIETCTVVCDCLRVLRACVCVHTMLFMFWCLIPWTKKNLIHYELIMVTEPSTEANRFYFCHPRIKEQEA